MEFLYFLESIRTPFLDGFFGLITHLGGESLFIVVAIIVFWCVNKNTGYYLMTVGFFGTLINQFLKLVCRVPRPWVRDPDFTIVESARADAAGYSFPSGHTQSITGTLGSIARSYKSAVLRGLCIVLIVLVSFSRMYLGVHTPADVCVSLVIGTALVLGLYPLFKNLDENPRRLYIIAGLLTVLSLAYVIFVETHIWPADTDAHNLSSGIKNGYLLLGCGCAMILAFFLERNYIKFETAAPWWAQIIKTALGLGIVLGLKAGLKPVLSIFFGDHLAATAVRYFLMVMFAACVWPLTFPWFAKGCPMSKKVKKLLKVLLIIIIVLVLLAGFLFWFVTRDTLAEPVSTEECTNPLITPVGVTMLSGHRAGGGIAPENTMMALKNCVENGEYRLDVFEFDIHLTSDGIPVLLHDSTLDRTSDAVEYFGEEGVNVGSKTLAELKNLNMGEKFKADDGSKPFEGLRGDDVPDDLRIVTLSEALSYLESCGEYRYIIEIKNSGDRGCLSADLLYDTLSDYGCLERTVVGTFNNEVTEYMDSTYPDMPRSAGFNEAIKFYLCSLIGLKVDSFPYVALQIPTDDYTVNLGTSRLVNYAHRHNIAVQYWTINDGEEMAYLQSIGADAIMTDVPDLGAKILNQP